MADYIVRATAANLSIRAFAAYTLDTVEEARKKHGLSPVACAALGRLLTGGAMMGSMLKNEEDQCRNSCRKRDLKVGAELILHGNTLSFGRSYCRVGNK